MCMVYSIPSLFDALIHSFYVRLIYQIIIGYIRRGYNMFTNGIYIMYVLHPAFIRTYRVMTVWVLVVLLNKTEHMARSAVLCWPTWSHSGCVSWSSRFIGCCGEPPSSAVFISTDMNERCTTTRRRASQLVCIIYYRIADNANFSSMYHTHASANMPFETYKYVYDN